METKRTIPQTKILSYILIAIIAFNAISMRSIQVMAISDTVQKQISTLTTSLKHILDNKKVIALNEIKNKLIENNWDYTLTMDSINESTIYKDVDYIDLIAAYMTAKDYSKSNGISFTYFEDLPILDYDIVEKEQTVPIPIKVPNFVKQEDETYIQSGSSYITEDKEIETYKEIRDGIYERDGTKIVTLDTEKVKYAEVSFNVMTAEKLLTEYDLPEDEFDKYRKRIKKLTETTDNNSLYQTMFARLPQGYTYEGNVELLKESYQRQLVVSTASTLIGMIPYQWGGKPTKPGYDTSWWLFNEDNVQRGLDCSGFVQWVYMTAGYDPEVYAAMASVASMDNSDITQEISKEELRPGDIGAWYGTITNHVGIYAGGGKWIHCTGGTKQTVVLDDFGFTKFFRAIRDDTEEDAEDFILNPITASQELVYANVTNETYSDEDILLIASLVQHEAGNEGLNGWIGVAEVVKNRIESEMFPNSAAEVIYQPGQFTTAKELADSRPSEDIINTTKMVMEGKMAILNNPACMYFRNPMITNRIPATEQVDWGKNKYYMPIGHHAFYLQA